MVSTPSTSPAPDAADLLHSFLAQGLDVLATAQHANTSATHLLRFLTRTDNQALIEAFQRAAFASLNIKILANTAQARINAVATLDQLSKKITDPVELRRVCNLILRYSTPLTRIPTSPLKPLPARLASLQTTPPTPARPPMARPVAVTPPPPCPAAIPAAAPFSSPDQLLRSLERSLLKQRPTTEAGRLAALHNLHRHLAPLATVNSTTVPESRDDFCRVIDDTTSAHLITQAVQVRRHNRHSDALTHTETLYITRHRQALIRAEISLHRESPTAPWLITKLTTRLNSA